MKLAAKLFGLLLLLLGVAIIVYSLYASWQIFTAKIPAFPLFKPVAVKAGGSSGGLGLEAQLEKMIGSQLQQLLPSEYLPLLFNLISWSVFAGILIFGGSQIAGLGIKLIK